MRRMSKSRTHATVAAMLVLGAAWAGACASDGNGVAETTSDAAGPSAGGGPGAGGDGGETSSTTGANGGSGGSDGGAGPGGGGTGGQATSSGSQSGGGGMGGATTGSGGACVSVSEEAQAGPVPADIIIAVDTSGSMDLESGEVQANLNNFASIIVASGIDVHVVLIADSSVCIPAPLGSGACPNDENLPGYRHVVEGVGSTDALQKIISTYPQYASSLRPQAKQTIAVVSDDDSDMSAGDFTNQLLALDPPMFQGFKFDAIVAFVDPVVCTATCLIAGCGTCPKCCPLCFPLSAAEGTVYKQLVQQTGGVIGDLCDQDFDAVFQDMATQIIASTPLGCEYDIPPPPMMMMIDPNKVNVIYTSNNMNPQTIPNVPDAASCANGGWYYDNPANPTKVILCPTTCATVSGDPLAKIEVAFGCDTLHI
jgi:hypothetical protein